MAAAESAMRYLSTILSMRSCLQEKKEEAVGQTFLISGPEPVTWGQFIGAYEKMIDRKATISMTKAEALDFYDTMHSAKNKKGTMKSTSKRSLMDWYAQYPVLVNMKDMIWPYTAMMYKKIFSGKSKRTVNTHSDHEKTAPVAPPVSPLDPQLIEIQSASTVVSIEKAKNILGYKPCFFLKDGMSVTESWARWANIL